MKKPYVPPEIEIRRIAFEETISASANDVGEDEFRPTSEYMGDPTDPPSI